MTKTTKEFEKGWNRFCRKIKFLCCCECALNDTDDDCLTMPKPIQINNDKHLERLERMVEHYNERNARWD